MARLRLDAPLWPVELPHSVLQTVLLSLQVLPHHLSQMLNFRRCQIFFLVFCEEKCRATEIPQRPSRRAYVIDVSSRAPWVLYHQWMENLIDPEADSGHSMHAPWR